MAEVVPVEVAPGAEVYVEVSRTGGGDVSVLDGLRLDDAAETIRAVGRWAVEHARAALPDGPDDVEVTFGIKLGVKSGKLISILAEANGEASLTVTMRWARDTTSPTDA